MCTTEKGRPWPLGDEALVILEVLADGTRATVRYLSGWLGGLMQAQAKAEKEAAEAKARAQEEARIKAEAEEAARCERVDPRPRVSMLLKACVDACARGRHARSRPWG